MFGGVCVDSDLTSQELLLDASTLHTESHRIVIMRCSRCNETFKREYRLRHKRHHCNLTNTNWRSIISDWFIRHISRLIDYNVRLECKIECSDAIIPTRTRSTDAGYDLYTITSKVLNPREVARFETGLRISAPDGWYYTIEGRSSLWSQGIVPFTGIIDGGYVGLIGVHLMNVSATPYTIRKGDRVAQMIVHKVRHADIVQVTNFSPQYNSRGNNGFGSSGR